MNHFVRKSVNHILFFWKFKGHIFQFKAFPAKKYFFQPIKILRGKSLCKFLRVKYPCTKNLILVNFISRLYFFRFLAHKTLTGYIWNLPEYVSYTSLPSYGRFVLVLSSIVWNSTIKDIMLYHINGSL